MQRNKPSFGGLFSKHSEEMLTVNIASTRRVHRTG